jgi:quercetin dioxygenase-like cupin family protein
VPPRADTYDHLGLRLRVRLTGQDNAGSLALIEHAGKHGAGSPLHRHTREAETSVVLDGALDGWSDGEHTDVPAGDSPYLPAGTEHAYRVRGDTARFLLLLTPAGFDRFFMTDGTPGDPGTELPPVPGPPPPEAVERLAQVLSEYGVAITGPPPTP